MESDITGVVGDRLGFNRIKEEFQWIQPRFYSCVNSGVFPLHGASAPTKASSSLPLYQCRFCVPSESGRQKVGEEP